MKLEQRPTARPLPPLAYASVGSTGQFGNAYSKDGDESGAQTWTFTCGIGWLYGLGVSVGPFFGTGVGFTIPGGVLAGAGGGVGIVIGIGMGSGLVWGTGRGVVKGLGVIPPMTPPFSDGLPRPSDLPSPRELARRTADYVDLLRYRVAQNTANRRRGREGPKLFFVPSPDAWNRLSNGRDSHRAPTVRHRRALALPEHPR